MDNLLIIVAFWLMLVGVWGGLSLVHSGRKNQSPRAPAPPQPRAPVRPRPMMRPRPSAGQTQPGAPVSEVDMLRAEVEHLRTELMALSSAAARQERPRTRHYRTGVYADLPRMLRRHVREVRNVRNPMHV